MSWLEHSVQEKKIIIFSAAINSLFMSFAKHINTETERKKRKYTLSIFMSFIPYYPIPTYLVSTYKLKKEILLHRPVGYLLKDFLYSSLSIYQ